VQVAAWATSRSAISRRFVARTKSALAELLARDLGPLDVKVLMIDGEHIADHCCIVALAITADGSKIPVGLREGSTENKTVARHLLADLVERGLDTDDGLLVVIDGAKALSAAVNAVFGAKAAIQRCTVHKRQNFTEHLPDTERAFIDAKLVRALNNPDAAAGLRDAKALATLLERKHPGAAASLREGLPELFTVARLGITGALAKTLTSSNPIESMISSARATNRNVTAGATGRWCCAGPPPAWPTPNARSAVSRATSRRHNSSPRYTDTPTPHRPNRRNCHRCGITSDRIATTCGTRGRRCGLTTGGSPRRRDQTAFP
jgi:putative transposase